MLFCTVLPSGSPVDGRTLSVARWLTIGESCIVFQQIRVVLDRYTYAGQLFTVLFLCFRFQRLKVATIIHNLLEPLLANQGVQLTHAREVQIG